MMQIFLFFFFSSRRRHTRYWRDWSSDVCSSDLDLLALDDALTRLAAEDAPAAEVVKLRVYAGLSVEEAAAALGLARATAYRHWTYARAWLCCALGHDSPSPAP